MSSPTTDSLRAIASVSHELRSPLHAIVGLAELLVEADLGAHEQQLASAIHRESQALQVIIDDLLDLSKLNAGQMTLTVKPFSPRALIDEVINMFSPAAAAKDLALTVNLDDVLPLAVRGDRQRVRQVLVNLISNAVKYTAVGTIDVAVTVDTMAVRDSDLPPEAGQQCLQIEVADTGPGIPQSALSELFDPFTQARTRDALKGTGLGLSISQQLTELMHGELRVQTSPTGSTFTVRVPVRPARRTADRIEAARLQRTARVLIVDDADVNRMVARSQLDRLGHDPVEASNGADAIAALTSDHFDAVLMDWHMPHQDGLETIRLYLDWASEHETVPPPIIMMTADVSADARTRCADAGASDFLSKPVSLQQLDACLRRWLPAHSADPDDDTHAIDIAAAAGVAHGLNDVERSGAGDGDSEVGAGANSAPAIDRSVLDQMIEDVGGEATVALVIATFADDAARRRVDLAADASPDGDSYDSERARRSAHTLKSTAAMLGAARLSATCHSIESTLDAGKSLDARLITTFNTQLDQSLRELQAIATELTRNQPERTAHPA